MEIIDLNPIDQRMIDQTANLLVIGFHESWPDTPSALAEVLDCLQAGKLNRVAVSGNDEVVGWIGGRRAYDGYVWELHPLIVHPNHRGAGIGRSLVQDFEASVKEMGGLTIYLGTDDLEAQTSLAGVDVYPNPLEHLAQIRNRKRHPYEFYQKLGFKVVGMVPDANGFGKPDIMMAKRVGG